MLKFITLFTVLLFCFCNQTEKSSLISLIEKHQHVKKNFAVQDAYKLIYQGVFGVAHIMENPERANQYLEKEYASVDSSKDEPLIEDISVAGEIVRINLRPYKYSGGSVDQLFEVMTQSVKETNGSKDDFLSLWKNFKQAVFDGHLKFDKQELEVFDRKIKAANYPAVHHSPGYRETNKPAYRVVKKSIAKKLLPNVIKFRNFPVISSEARNLLTH